MPNQSAEVDLFLQTLDHPLKEAIIEVRAIILNANSLITEHIKWNAPSFCYHGEDRVTMSLRPGKGIQLIFHRGAKVKDSAGFAFQDDTGLLEWVTNDRAIVKLQDMEDVEAKRASLATVVRQWMEETGE